jgi:hypothetical protein
MSELSKIAIAVCIVLSAVSIRSTASCHLDAGLCPVETTDAILVKEMRHPSSREYVSGPWPRFVKKMLA